jgi:hypothetical protein
METIREKVARLDGLRRELRTLAGRAESDEYRLFPPPAAGEVRAHERRIGRPFPASYRAFLELANAWRGFMNGWTLLGLRRRETELFFREGVDEKVLGALRDLVPDAELRSLSSREKTDPKVLSPRDHHVIGVDGRGSVLVLDDLRTNAGEPELALVKYVWVQKRWPSFGAMLDEAIGDATRELDRLRGAASPAALGGPAGKKKGAKAKTKASKRKASAAGGPAVPKLRVVEIRPPSKTKSKSKSADKGKTKIAAKSASKPSKASKPTKPAANKASKKKR